MEQMRMIIITDKPFMASPFWLLITIYALLLSLYCTYRQKIHDNRSGYNTAGGSSFQVLKIVSGLPSRISIQNGINNRSDMAVPFQDEDNSVPSSNHIGGVIDGRLVTV